MDTNNTQDTNKIVVGLGSEEVLGFKSTIIKIIDFSRVHPKYSIIAIIVVCFLISLGAFTGFKLTDHKQAQSKTSASQSSPTKSSPTPAKSSVVSSSSKTNDTVVSTTGSGGSSGGGSGSGGSSGGGSGSGGSSGGGSGSGGSSGGGSGSGSPSNDFITASGTNLMLNGKVWQFIGFNTYGMAGCWNGTSGSAWTDAQLDAYFSGLPANGLTRLWSTQEWGTTVISNIVAQAAKYNQHVILVLGNDDGNCDATADDPNQTGEPLSFYQSTWKTQYVSWVNTIVPIFANNPTVAMWEIANEPGQAVSVPESTMQSYLSGAAAAIKAVDPNQLIESGVNDSANMGGGESNYQAAQSSPDINVISFHDYAWDYENGATLSSNFTTAQQAAAALNKPFIAGEAGVEACNPASGTNSQNGLPWMTPSQRVTYLTTKANDYLHGIGPSGQGSPDVAGIMFWDYLPTGSDRCAIGNYDVFPGDPLLPVVQNYSF